MQLIEIKECMYVYKNILMQLSTYQVIIYSVIFINDDELYFKRGPCSISI